MSTDLFSNIATVSTELIYNKTLSSFLLLISNTLEDAKESAINNELEIPTNILEIKKTIKNQISALKLSLLDDEIKTAAIEDIFKAKETLLEVARCILYYKTKLTLFSQLLSNENLVKDCKNKELSFETLDLSVFYTDCIDFIQEATTADEQESRMQQLFECLPLKMARNNFFSLVEDSLKLLLEGATENDVNEFFQFQLQTNAPELNPEYGKYFQDVIAYFENKLTLNIEDLSPEDFDNEFDELDDIVDTLENINSQLVIIQENLCYLTILFSLGFTVDSLTENNFEIKDIYLKTCEIIENPQEEIFIDATMELLEPHIDSVIDESLKLDKRELSLMKKIKDFSKLPEELTKTIEISNFIQNTFYKNLNDEIFAVNRINNEETTASKEFIESKIKDHISTLQKYYENQPLKLRKLQMSMLLSQLPTNMEIKQLMDYIKDGIDNSKTEAHSIAIIEKIGMIFKEYDFKVDNKEDEDYNY
ncbi:MAG: hypothetical protein ACRCW1_07945 [Anaerotignaceae bacterium]